MAQSELQSIESSLGSSAGLAQISLAVFGAIQITKFPVPKFVFFLISAATAVFLIASILLQSRLINKYRRLYNSYSAALCSVSFIAILLLFAAFLGLFIFSI
jgi:hypothetical protein